MGRPLKSGRKVREKFISIRVNEEEKAEIENLSKKLSLSRTDTILKGIELLKNSLLEK